MRISKEKFNKEEIKKMSKKEFIIQMDFFKDDNDLEALYYEICGKPAKSKEKKDKE
jgi:hypothetical protein